MKWDQFEFCHVERPLPTTTSHHFRVVYPALNTAGTNNPTVPIGHRPSLSFSPPSLVVNLTATQRLRHTKIVPIHYFGSCCSISKIGQTQLGGKYTAAGSPLPRAILRHAGFLPNRKVNTSPRALHSPRCGRQETTTETNVGKRVSVPVCHCACLCCSQD